MMPSPVDPGHQWLEDCVFNDYSQTGEDGVLEAVFSVIGETNQWCCECGAADGLFFSNTRRLMEHGWNGVLVEADERAFDLLKVNTACFGDRAHLERAFVTRERRLETILHKHGAPLDIDLVVIDVDGQDYYVWNSLLRYRPRVVVVEFNAAAEYDYCPAIGEAGQGGLLPLCKLGAGKLYDCVWVSRFNMVFVARPLNRLLLGSRKGSSGEPTA